MLLLLQRMSRMVVVGVWVVLRLVLRRGVGRRGCQSTRLQSVHSSDVCRLMQLLLLLLLRLLDLMSQHGDVGRGVDARRRTGSAAAAASATRAAATVTTVTTTVAVLFIRATLRV